MPIVSYCKKCKAEVAPASTCELCGGKLQKTAARVSWSCLHRPLTDWLAWNAPLRIAIPTIVLVAVVAFVFEAVQSGPIGLQLLLKTWFFPLIGGLLFFVIGAVFLYYLRRGNELNFFVLDHKGAHLQLYSAKNPDHLHLISERHLAWSEIRRIQALPERNAILFYAPKNWLSMVLYCDAQAFLDAAGYIQARISKAKDVRLSKPAEGLDDIT